jgi:hypothetical protein
VVAEDKFEIGQPLLGLDYNVFWLQLKDNMNCAGNTCATSHLSS